MIALLSFACIIGIFLAGHYYAAHALLALGVLGFACIILGALTAFMELRALEGQRIEGMPLPMTWEKLWLQVLRLSVGRNEVPGSEPVYVLTDNGVMPVTGFMTARINHTRSFILDITEAPEYAKVSGYQVL